LRMIGTNTDISERKQAAAVDQFLAQTFGDPQAESFFVALARFLADSLQMDYVCVDRIDTDHLNATTLVALADGKLIDNLSYALADTPCAEVVGQRVCGFASQVCQRFPKDLLLQEWQVESYIGATLWSHTGQPIGLIAMMGRHPLINRDYAETTLIRVAVRAAGELERLDAEAALQISEARFRQLLNDIPLVAVQGYGADGITHFWNQASEHLYGYYADEALGRSLLDTIIPVEMHDGVRQAMQQMFETATPIPPGELSLRRKDGSRVDVFSSHAYVQVPGQPPEMFCVDLDLTERKQAQARLQLAASVFSHAREGITITDADGNILEVNDAFTRITGYGRDEVIGQNPRLLKSGRHDEAFYATLWSELLSNGHWSGEIWNRRKNGEVYAELLNISAVRDERGITRQYVGLFSDISARKVMEDRVRQLAFFDALTELPNRRLLADRLGQAMLLNQRSGHYGALMFLDLDNFKPLNDTHGHATGDLLLIEVARRLKACVRQVDTVARIGGDEFVVMLSELDTCAEKSRQQAQILAENVRQSIARPYLLTIKHHGAADSQVEHRCSASIGVAMFASNDNNQERALKHADSAMYQAKDAGRNCVVFYQADQ